MQYPLNNLDEVQNTKERILLTAAMMFAQHGYGSVSVRDIAEKVNIKPASIYSHYESKEALFDAIVETINEIYMTYYNRMDERIANVTSFEGVLDCLFSELLVIYHMFIYYGVALIATEQFRNEKAGHAFNNVYMKEGIDYTTKIFSDCIKRKWVKDFDARGLATLLMNCVFAGSLMIARQDLNFDTVYDPKEMFKSLKRHMLNSVEVIT